MNNVTPINSNDGSRTKASRGRCRRFHLGEPDEQPDNLRVIQALHGVCYAIEQLAEEHGPEVAIQLGTAAEILSVMLQERIE